LLPLVPPLAYLDFKKEFCIATDASDVSISTVLYQVVGGQLITTTNVKYHQYILFLARSLKPSKRKYSTTHRELLAIIYSLTKFHSYLWGNPFTLFTDHWSLIFLHTQPILNPMMTTWMDILLSYTYKVIHWPRILNILPDHLSKLFPPSIRGNIRINYVGKINNTRTSEVIPQVELMDREIPKLENRLKLLQEKYLLGYFRVDIIINKLYIDNII